MSEKIDTIVTWKPILEELKQVLEGKPSNGMAWLRDEIYQLCGYCPVREMPKHIPADVKEQARALFIDAMVRGDQSRVRDVMWKIGAALGMWARTYPQSTPDHAIEQFACEASNR